jgi:hypothetical protein
VNKDHSFLLTREIASHFRRGKEEWERGRREGVYLSLDTQ